MSLFDIFSPSRFAGSWELEEDTTYVASIWHIPNLTDYDKAFIRYVFFPSETEVDAFCEMWDAPPEMASKMTVEEYKALHARIKVDEETHRKVYEEYDQYYA